MDVSTENLTTAQGAMNIALERRDLAMKLNQRMRDAINIRAEIALYESRLMQEISAEKDPGTGKPVYSNETARKAALKERVAENPDLCELHARLDITEREYREGEITLRYYDDLLRISLAYAETPAVFQEAAQD